MCRIYAGTDPREYEPVTRSLRLHGAVTSIRLEARFWTILDEMAEAEGTTTPKLLAKLHDEVLELHGAVRNFASLLRVACAVHLERADRAQHHRRPATAVSHEVSTPRAGREQGRKRPDSPARTLLRVIEHDREPEPPGAVAADLGRAGQDRLLAVAPPAIAPLHVDPTPSCAGSSAES